MREDSVLSNGAWYPGIGQARRGEPGIYSLAVMIEVVGKAV